VINPATGKDCTVEDIVKLLRDKDAMIICRESQYRRAKRGGSGQVSRYWAYRVNGDVLAKGEKLVDVVRQAKEVLGWE